MSYQCDAGRTVQTLFFAVLVTILSDDTVRSMTVNRPSPLASVRSDWHQSSAIALTVYPITH